MDDSVTLQQAVTAVTAYNVLKDWVEDRVASMTGRRYRLESFDIDTRTGEVSVEYDGDDYGWGDFPQEYRFQWVELADETNTLYNAAKARREADAANERKRRDLENAAALVRRSERELTERREKLAKLVSGEES